MILNFVSVLPARRCRQQCSLALVCLSDCQVRGEPPRGAGPPAWEEGCLWRAEAAAAAPLWLRVIPSRSARRTVYPSGVPTARRRGHRASWEETCWRDRWVTPTRRFYSVTLECSRPVGDKRPFVNMRRTTHVKNILWVKGCICVAATIKELLCRSSLSCYTYTPQSEPLFTCILIAGLSSREPCFLAGMPVQYRPVEPHCLYLYFWAGVATSTAFS